MHGIVDEAQYFERTGRLFPIGVRTEKEVMKIIQLRREDIPIVTEGCGQAFIDDLINELEKAELTGCVIYVRYGPMFVQRLRVDEAYLRQPGVLPMLLDEDMWEHQEPNAVGRDAW